MITIKISGSIDRKALVEEANKKLKSEADQLKQDLVKTTPVDTGLASNSWVVKETTKGYTIENDVEYVKYLNAGTSEQAPAHFIEKEALKYGTPSGPIVDYED